ncbi:MAG TPA: hypothetical protein VFO16_23825 [Pseudonocardiaceae bacterium]|nr:hypothetical protein [Pseudonocardiaceae bacterium]
MRSARRPEHPHREHEQRFAWYVEDIIAACGLTRVDYSVAGDRAIRIPRVISVNPGPPVSVDVRILSGQLASDFATHAEAIAYDLEVSEVRVVPIGPSVIRLELLS